MKSCYGEQLNTAGLAGDHDAYLIRYLMSQQLLSVISIDNAMGLVNDRIHKLQIFLVAASSSIHLQEILKRMKNSPWWNHMASIFIFDRPERPNGCWKAFEMLWTCWQMNLINAKFVCLDQKSGPLIYSYNPYIIRAPAPWHLENTYSSKNNHSWGLFVRQYHQGICDDLDFDKTRDMGGYEIPCSVENMPWSWCTDLDSDVCLGKINVFVANMIFRALNATAKILVYKHEEMVGYQDKNGNDIALDTIHGISDMALNPRYHPRMINFTTTYPHWESGMSVVTKYRGNLSEFSKILSVLDKSSRYGLLLVFFMSIIYFKFVLQQSPMTAFLNNFRLICNSCLLELPIDVGSRIYLSTLFIYTLTILAIYQGQLASLLTKAVPLREINTIQDIADLDYTIHGYHGFTQYFKSTIVEDRFVGRNEFDCIDVLEEKPRVGCATEHYNYIIQSAKNKTHLCKEVMVKINWVYVIRPDWPPESRVNKILATLTETNIIRYEFMREPGKVMRVVAYNEKMDQEAQFRIIKLSEITFAFVILGIGLGCASLTFIIEMIVHKKCTRRKKYGPCNDTTTTTENNTDS